MKNLSSMFLVFTPSAGVEHFWMDLDVKHVLRTPSVEAIGICGVYVILILRA
jgi:cobyric acid synthase